MKRSGSSVCLHGIGFTLVELLIVVAIISILAAIAIPNYLEAQVRAKVARVHSDLRTYGLAIEIYYVDNGSYPSWPMGGDNDQRCAANGMWRGCNDPVPFELTTPIAYITTILDDPFPARPPYSGWKEPPGYFHQNANSQRWTGANDFDRGCETLLMKWRGYTFGPFRVPIYQLPKREVRWQFWSWGPDGVDNGGQGCWPGNWAVGSWGGAYDASNGTVSHGDIARFGP